MSSKEDHTYTIYTIYKLLEIKKNLVYTYVKCYIKELSFRQKLKFSDPNSLATKDISSFIYEFSCVLSSTYQRCLPSKL